MEQDHREITVHTMGSVHGRGPVFYASLQCANDILNRCGADGARYKHRLVSTLWGHLMAMEIPLWKRCQSPNKAAFPIQVARGLLGRPHLLLGEIRGPAISFSQGGGNVWAALCGDESDIGVDVAGAAEFQSGYPFHRVFQPQELQHAVRLAGGDLELASALLWSVKESVVKALGYLSGGLIREGPGTVSHSGRPVPVGTFGSAGEDVAFDRPFESETDRP